VYLVVFDIDGTLTDTNKVDNQCYWQAVSEVFGLSGAQPDWSKFAHVTDTGIATELCSQRLGREPSRAEIDAVASRLVTLLAEALGPVSPIALQIPGSAEILAALGESPDFAIALATGGFRISAELKLRRADLPFAPIPLASATDAVSRANILRIAAGRAAGKHGTEFAHITYVGDGVWDVEAARTVGWRFLGIGSGTAALRLRQAGAKVVVPNYFPIETFLRRLGDRDDGSGPFGDAAAGVLHARTWARVMPAKHTESIFSGGMPWPLTWKNVSSNWKPACRK